MQVKRRGQSIQLPSFSVGTTHVILAWSELMLACWCHTDSDASRARHQVQSQCTVCMQDDANCMILICCAHCSNLRHATTHLLSHACATPLNMGARDRPTSESRHNQSIIAGLRPSKCGVKPRWFREHAQDCEKLLAQGNIYKFTQKIWHAQVNVVLNALHGSPAG